MRGGYCNRRRGMLAELEMLAGRVKKKERHDEKRRGILWGRAWPQLICQCASRLGFQG